MFSVFLPSFDAILDLKKKNNWVSSIGKPAAIRITVAKQHCSNSSIPFYTTESHKWLL